MKLIAALACSLLITTSAYARDQVRIVGSSTVFPFSTMVAENFGKTSDFKAPIVESTGTGGGMKLFCSGVGESHPDITNASRAIKQTEVDKCKTNGVTPIEVLIGFDGIVFAHSKSSFLNMKLTKKQLFLALAKHVPNADGKLVENPNVLWSDVDPLLPNVKIRVMGPPPTSGTRDAFLELVMESAAKQLLPDMPKEEFKVVAHTMREDGHFIEAGENDNLIVQKLEADPELIGIFGFSFLDQNNDKVEGIPIDGVKPLFETIASGDYSVSRPLFFYVKKEHLQTGFGLREFVEEFISETAIGQEGYTTDQGLIPLPEDEYNRRMDEVRKQIQ